MFVAKKCPESSFAQFRASGAQLGSSSYLPFSQKRNRANRIKTWLSGLIRWIGHICCEKISRKFIRTVSCIRCTTRIKLVLAVFTLAKWPEMHQNMSFGSNMVDWDVRCETISGKFGHIVSCIRCTVCTAIFTLAESCETHQNMSFGSNKKDWACL